MAKVKTTGGRRQARTKPGRKAAAATRKQITQAKRGSAASRARHATARRPLGSPAEKTARARKKPAARAKPRERLRPLEETIPTPPSSLDLARLHGSAVRTGRAEMAERRRKRGAMSAITGGDVDANPENAYFTGDEVPGGDNPTPDQDIVDDIGRAVGVEYQDNEELKGSNKIIERDKHRWELDPASSEDYKERK